MPEWLMGADCKSAGYAYAGSNPARPILIKAIMRSLFNLVVVQQLIKTDADYVNPETKKRWILLWDDIVSIF